MSMVTRFSLPLVLVRFIESESGAPRKVTQNVNNPRGHRYPNEVCNVRLEVERPTRPNWLGVELDRLDVEHDDAIGRHVLLVERGSVHEGDAFMLEHTMGVMNVPEAVNLGANLKNTLAQKLITDGWPQRRPVEESPGRTVRDEDVDLVGNLLPDGSKLIGFPGKIERPFLVLRLPGASVDAESGELDEFILQIDRVGQQATSFRVGNFKRSIVISCYGNFELVRQCTQFIVKTFNLVEVFRMVFCISPHGEVTTVNQQIAVRHFDATKSVVSVAHKDNSHTLICSSLFKVHNSKEARSKSNLRYWRGSNIALTDTGECQSVNRPTSKMRISFCLYAYDAWEVETGI